MAAEIFKKYTLAIADDYMKTAEGIKEAQKVPPKRIYGDMTSLLKECYFLGATRYGTNFIC